MQTIANEISNLTDARYFSAMGVEWMQYSMDSASEAAINPTVLNGIKAWVEGPKTIVDLGLESPETIKNLAESLDIDSFSLPMFYPIEDLEQLGGITIFQKLVISKDLKLEWTNWVKNRADFLSHLHLDFAINKFSWKNIMSGESPMDLATLINLQSNYSCFLSLWGLEASDINDLRTRLPNIGLVLKGGEEEKVGFKSYDELDEIFEVLEEL